jgi:hypothetical protein
MVRRQIELAGAARDAGALLDRHEPVVFPQVLPDLAGHGEQCGGGLLDVLDYAEQSILRNVRVVLERQQDLLLPLQLLQQVRLEIGAACNLENLEQRQQRDVMVVLIRQADEMTRALEQVFKAQERADTLVEGVLVGDHGATNCRYFL